MAESDTDNGSLMTALSSMQSATEACVKATEDILDHNTDPEAHPDIRARVEEILDTDNVYTRPQIEEIVEDGIADHITDTFDVAHPGWAEYSKDLESRLNEMQKSIDSIQSWIDGTSGSGDITDLSMIIQAIENKYDVMLTSIETAMKEARENGQTETLNRLQNEYDAIMDTKSEEIKQAIMDWKTQAGGGGAVPPEEDGKDDPSGGSD